MQEELPRELLQDVVLQKAIALALDQELPLRVALREVQRKHQAEVGADANDRVVGEDELGLRVDLFLSDVQRVPRTDHVLFGDVDVHFLGVEDIGALPDLLEDVDGAFGEVVEGIDLLQRVRVHLEVVGRVDGQQLRVVQASCLQLDARSP